MIALANSSAQRSTLQAHNPQPPAPAAAADNAGFAATVERYQSLKARQKVLEADARKLKSEADMLETALADATEAAGGTMQAGRFVLGFELKSGQPSYKSICEYIIASNRLPPDTLAREVAQTEKRRVLVIA